MGFFCEICEICKICETYEICEICEIWKNFGKFTIMLIFILLNHSNSQYNGDKYEMLIRIHYSFLNGLDWLIFTAFQPLLSYLMPRDYNFFVNIS